MGVRQTPEMIVNAALQESVQVIGLSILSGAHNAIVPRVLQLLRERDMTEVLVIDAVFHPDALLEYIVRYIRENLHLPELSVGSI